MGAHLNPSNDSRLDSLPMNCAYIKNAICSVLMCTSVITFKELQMIHIQMFICAFINPSVPQTGLCWENFINDMENVDVPDEAFNYQSLVNIEGILPKGPFLPCVSMTGRALLAWYHRYMIGIQTYHHPSLYNRRVFDLDTFRLLNQTVAAALNVP